MSSAVTERGPSLSVSSMEGKPPPAATPPAVPAATAATTAAWLKWTSLVFLVTQNASVVLIMRMARSRTDHAGHMFISTTAVIMQELMKAFTCALLVLYQSGGSVGKFIHTINTQIIQQPIDTLKVAVPSFLYVIQNNLLYVAITHLNAATFQITYQTKILTTALFSVALLKRTLHELQWLSLGILFAGVCIVQLEQQQSSIEEESGIEEEEGESTKIEQKPLVGLGAVLVACIMSGFSGVYFERILKTTESVSIWVRNIQLSVISLPIAWITLEIQDGHTMRDVGFFHGYNTLVWSAICCHALGGLLVAVVVKYADNILKGFATSAAIIFSCLGSVYLFNFHITALFSLGATLVIVAMFVYSNPIITMRMFKKERSPIRSI